MIAGWPNQLIVFILHLCIAGLITTHILLRKRDVAAAIGWIGIAWLAPALGAALYFGFGINRVRRRARRLMRPELRPSYQPTSIDHETPLPDLELAIAAITRSPTTGGKVSAMLFCGDAAYPEMLDAIARAETSIRLASYIFRADDWGAKFIAALADAHRRGVAVRVLIDGFGGGFLTSPAYRRLRAEGVPCARFLHSLLPWKMAFLNLRLHKKLLAVDGKIAYAGGLNIGSENVLSAHPKHPVSDHHFRLLGPVIGAIEKEFDEDWQFAKGEANARGDVAARSHAPGACRVISSGPDQETDHLVLVLLAAVNAARKHIRVATPYFLPDEQLVTALRLAALRGVTVDIVLPADNNHPFVAWAMQAHVRPIIESGCRIWFNPPPFDHSKLMTVDGEWSLIGSGNWDARSLRLNFEMTIEFRDAAFAAELERTIDARRGRLLTLSELDSRPLGIRLRDAAIRLAMPYI